MAGGIVLFGEVRGDGREAPPLGRSNRTRRCIAEGAGGHWARGLGSFHPSAVPGRSRGVPNLQGRLIKEVPKVPLSVPGKLAEAISPLKGQPGAKEPSGWREGCSGELPPPYLPLSLLRKPLPPPLRSN